MNLTQPQVPGYGTVLAAAVVARAAWMAVARLQAALGPGGLQAAAAYKSGHVPCARQAANAPTVPPLDWRKKK
ncbi:hypothetical protein HXX76_015008 [Chlamydomonas incerta]|uniref:Uncharacterized protein n=1 Tax=Chlamydomonas incerta TaxID=51695 RepID=A0A835SAR8_CHLIN|nr:hypothetical protein HXX76_015008 [Chlamydomonas incerta]|eukprot:KAG2423848.1 hypothetical protein HXX76_015008 [Chlamydomonas incerta]